MRTRSKLICAILTAVTVVQSVLCIPVCAFGAEKHDDFLEKVLFGTNMSFTSEREEKAMNAIEYASYICLDYTATNNEAISGAKAFTYLKEQKVPGLPKSIDMISGPGGPYHREYTHYGWRKGFQDKDEATWDTRKSIMLSTTNQVFDFGFWSGKLWFGYDEKCDSFCALVYYVHILGDHMATTNYRIANTVIPLARNNASDEEPSLIYELKKYLPILFADQITDPKHIPRNYEELMSKLNTIENDACKILNSKGSLSETTDIGAYNECATELMSVLTDYIPPLLQKETFFIEVFESVCD